MTVFVRLLDEGDKANALLSIGQKIRAGRSDCRAFEVVPSSFRVIPTTPFAYWTSKEIRDCFGRLKSLVDSGLEAWKGLSTGNNFQWIRLPWEVLSHDVIMERRQSQGHRKWAFFAKGGEFATYYQRSFVLVNWADDGEFLNNWKLAEFHMGRITENNSKCWNQSKYFRPGITWSARSQKGASFRVMPPNCILGSKGPAVLVEGNDADALLAQVALSNSTSFNLLLNVQMAFGAYEVGVIQRTPIPDLNAISRSKMAKLAGRAWVLKRELDKIEETSQSFLLPALLLSRSENYFLSDIDYELEKVQAEIDVAASELYGISGLSSMAVNAIPGEASQEESEDGLDDEVEGDENAEPVDLVIALLSWSIGTAFGRFDCRLATGECAAPPEPEPFDPLPAKSPGMLPDGAAPFHAHAGILVDDAGHPHDLVRVVEEVLARVDACVPNDLRRWLQKDFFPFHLQRYSKSRRKAPIYWPLSTVSGSYTLWVYYPSLDRQTLYTAINDFVEPKLKQVDEDVATLRNKGTARTRDDEKQFEALQTLAQELSDLRDTLQDLAHGYQPNHDDGVQITAAPLWPLFRHKPWQKLLKDTWAKLEKGDYDWARLAMAYWPERVREKCKTDKSLAIAHGLEDLYIEPEAAPKKTRGRKKADA